MKTLLLGFLGLTVPAMSLAADNFRLHFVDNGATAIAELHSLNEKGLTAELVELALKIGQKDPHSNLYLAGPFEVNEIIRITPEVEYYATGTFSTSSFEMATDSATNAHVIKIFDDEAQKTLDFLVKAGVPAMPFQPSISGTGLKVKTDFIECVRGAISMTSHGSEYCILTLN